MKAIYIDFRNSINYLDGLTDRAIELIRDAKRVHWKDMHHGQGNYYSYSKYEFPDGQTYYDVEQVAINLLGRGGWDTWVCYGLLDSEFEPVPASLWTEAEVEAEAERLRRSRLTWRIFPPKLEIYQMLR